MQSRRWFDYVADDGVTYAIERDESNTRAVNPLADVAGVSTSRSLPKGLKPRYVTIQFPSGAIRNCVVLKPATMPTINVGAAYLISNHEADDVIGTTGNVIYKTGEIIRRQPRVQDTGQTDGSQP